MAFAPVSGSQIQAATIVTGLAMAAFVAAPMFGRWAQTIRIGLTAIYIVAILIFVVWTFR